MPDERWNDWRWQLSNRVNTVEEIGRVLNLTDDERAGLSTPDKFRVDITPYFLSLIDPDDPNDPIRRQVIPTDCEHEAFTAMMEDSLAEDRHSPVPGLVHRYPDRVLMLVTTQCASYCRYCTRSRIVGDATQNFNRHDIEAQLDYLRRTPQVRDVLLSGGDAPDAQPQAARVDHARPARDPAHRDHPHRLARAGLPAAAHRRRAVRDAREVPPAVDEPPLQPPERDSRPRSRARPTSSPGPASRWATSRSCSPASTTASTSCGRSSTSSSRYRIRPYYIYQCDLVEGSGHFRTPVGKGIEIMEGLRGHTSGYAVPDLRRRRARRRRQDPGHAQLPDQLLATTRSCCATTRATSPPTRSPTHYTPHDKANCKYCQHPRPEPGQGGVEGLLDGKQMWIEPSGFEQTHLRGPSRPPAPGSGEVDARTASGPIEGPAGEPLRGAAGRHGAGTKDFAPGEEPRPREGEPTGWSHGELL